MDIENEDVICCNCTINEVMDTFQIEYEELEHYPKINVVGYGEEVYYSCEKCEEELQPLDLYFESEENLFVAMKLIGREIARVLSFEIEHCSSCAGSDLEEYEYRATKEDIPVQSFGIDLYDFFEEKQLPEEYHKFVLSNLRCSGCGYGESYHPKHNPNGGEFNYTDKIYSSIEIDQFWGFEEEFIKIAKDYGFDLSSEQIEDFIDYCSTNPLMASKHELAEILFRIVKEFYEDETTVSIIYKDSLLYRGRSRAKDTNQFAVNEMGMPPRGVASHGRYNLIGTSVLYLTNNKLGVPYEIEPRKNEVVDISTFFVKENLNLFKVDEAFKGFSMYISKENEESITVKRNYLFTNFLASVCNEIGFDGIYYKGAGDKPYFNIALFDGVLDKVDCKNEIETLNIKTIYDI
ncbi:hypothetical protein [Lysinibacillus sp. LZ02]|uniref:hypothetical protein n=1 Tax=Lysinibacillus sp. LZ02 TaxID=3420668 RepID=UPI003D35EF0B